MHTANPITMLRKFLYFAVNLLFRLLTRVEVIGLENQPRSGGCILASNHLSRLDPALIFALGQRQDMTALVADKYRRNLLIRPLITAVGGIWLNREQADAHALRAAREFLQAGGMLGIAPEGTRSRTGTLQPAKTGVAYLADKANVPVLPVAICGTETAIRQLLRLRRPHITVQYGKLIRLAPISRANREADLRRNTDEIMCRIAAMLPPQYRGVYADHPRLKELLEKPARRD